MHADSSAIQSSTPNRPEHKCDAYNNHFSRSLVTFYHIIFILTEHAEQITIGRLVCMERIKDDTHRHSRTHTIYASCRLAASHSRYSCVCGCVHENLRVKLLGTNCNGIFIIRSRFEYISVCHRPAQHEVKERMCDRRRVVAFEQSSLERNNYIFWALFRHACYGCIGPGPVSAYSIPEFAHHTTSTATSTTTITTITSGISVDTIEN